MRPLFASVVNDWLGVAGDPTLLGWLTVAMYCVSSLLCWQVGTRMLKGGGSAQYPREEIRLWFGLAAVLLCLGVNKQLDLQVLFMSWMKALSHQQGWYESRRFYQRAFVLMLLGCSVVAAVLLLRTIARVGWSGRQALAGAAILLSFALLRASLFQHFGAPQILLVLQQDLSHGLEVLGILIIGTAATVRLRRTRVPAEGPKPRET